MWRPFLVLRRYAACALLGVLASCGGERSGEVPGSEEGVPTKPGGDPKRLPPGGMQILQDLGDSMAQEGPLFAELNPEETGVEFVHPIDNEHPLNRLYISGFAAGGVAVGDVDGDGMVDLYLTRGPGRNALYRQVAPFRFEDITSRAGVGMDDVWSAGAAMVDINGDGHLDLYVCGYESPNRLFLNGGDGTFEDVAEQAGVAVSDSSLMAYFQDYDGDGDLDFYLLTNRLYREGGRPAEAPYEVRDGKPELLPGYELYYRVVERAPNDYVIQTVGRPDRLFRNEGGLKFSDVTESAGISGDHYGLSAVWFDYDNDGDADLYVANDFKDPDRLYENDGEGQFREVIGEVMPHTPWFSMGSDAADLNQDGLLDLVVLDMSSTTHYKEKLNMGDMSQHQHFMDHAEPRQLMRNAYFINSGSGRFLEAAHLSGLSSSDWSWAVKLADFDNDTHTDVYITNGMTAELTNADLGFDPAQVAGREEWSYLKDKPRRTEPNMAFANRGGFRFEKVGAKWGLNHDGMSYAAAWADFDKDGHLDLVVANLEENVSIYRNRGSSGSRVLFSLRGRGENSLGIGAEVTVRSGSVKQVRVLNPGTGFLSSNEPVVHFGLADQGIIDEVRVRWPDGTGQLLLDVPVDVHAEIVQPEASTPLPAERSRPLFRPLTELKVAEHRETPFDDFAEQPLLPNKMSQLGPGLAVGDLDGDGDDDFVMGGARGEVPTAHFREGDGYLWGYFRSAQYEKPNEDMASLLIDVEGDGDTDWLVVSGGVEQGENERWLEDRLYVQVKEGQLLRAEGALPEGLRFSGGGAAAADVDRDGDLDVAIAGRVIPGKYPLSPGSVLLRNETEAANQPRFSNATEELAPGLKTLEMATSVLWSDVNDDGWIDLLATTEWGPVRIFLNRRGRLQDATERSGLAGYLGWWNGIAGRDFDGDGDMDYVVTNFGGNTKYHPTPDDPSRLYYGSFGENEEPQIIEAKVKGGEILPVRGKSCSQNAMPFLRDKFPTYHDFASATLTEIYTDTALETAQQFEVNHLESAVLLNDGTGQFTWRPLPDLVQLAPGFGVVATEVDGDGNADIYVVQNFFTPQRETGKMAGGLSVLLLGDGGGGFRPLWPNESGLVVPGDAKALAATDFNEDGWVDFLVSQNNDVPLVFENAGAGSEDRRPLTVLLQGKGRNRNGIGARVTVHSKSGKRQMAEVHAGSGYLSQSSRKLFFASQASDPAVRISVRWPDGSPSEHAVGENTRLTLVQPE